MRSLGRFLAVSLVLPALPVGAGAQPPGRGSSTSTGISNLLNPAVSVNALFLGSAWDVEAPPALLEDWPAASADPALNGIGLQEAEIQCTAVVDPFLKADVTVAFSEEEGAAVEVGSATFTGMPHGLSAHAGRLAVPLGKTNALHTHQLPFVEPPLVHQMLIGEEAYRDVGVDVSWLAPVPWYAEVVAGVYGGGEPFDPERDALAALGRLYSLWDMGEATTLELGGAMLRGPAAPNAGDDEPFDTLVEADVTVKWVPARAAERRAFVWQAELLRRRTDGAPDVWGFQTHARTRVTRRWWVQAGAGQVRPEAGGDWTEARAALIFAPSEFSAFRMEVDRFAPEGGDANWAARAQLNFTIGSHPAHLY